MRIASKYFATIWMLLVLANGWSGEERGFGRVLPDVWPLIGATLSWVAGQKGLTAGDGDAFLDLGRSFRRPEPG